MKKIIFYPIYAVRFSDKGDSIEPLSLAVALPLNPNQVHFWTKVTVPGSALDLKLYFRVRELLVGSEVQELSWTAHSPSSLSLFISCCRVGRAYIPADTAFLMAHPWYGANTCWYAFDAGSFKEFPLPKDSYQLWTSTDKIQILQISKFCNNTSQYLATSLHLRSMNKQTKNLRFIYPCQIGHQKGRFMWISTVLNNNWFAE